MVLCKLPILTYSWSFPSTLHLCVTPLLCLCLSFHLIDFNVYIYFLTFARCIIFVLYHIVFWKLTTWNNLIFFPSSTLCTFHSLFYILIAQVPAVIKLIIWTIKSILIHEYQHGETRVWRESTQLQHESTQINTNLKQIYITKKKKNKYG